MHDNNFLLYAITQKQHLLVMAETGEERARLRLEIDGLRRAME